MLSTKEGRIRAQYQPRPNGVIRYTLPWPGESFLVTGGPFDAMPYTSAQVGVCVRAENVPPFADIKVPIEDFEVPHDLGALADGLLSAFKAALDGKHVYVGCQGGWGRTGLFLALMAKVTGAVDPVSYVRQLYSRRAVETQEQAEFVRQFDVTQIQRAVRAYTWRDYARGWVDYFFGLFRRSN